MKNFLLLICLLVVNMYCIATNYYVSVNGNDGNNGKSVSTAFRNIQKAADIVNPGDSVFVLNGVYKPAAPDLDVVVIRRKGTANAPIVFINYPNHKPILKPTFLNGIILVDGAAYIEINGFTIQGNASAYSIDSAKNQGESCSNPNAPFEYKYNTNGISAEGRPTDSRGHPHHLRILNNEIFECGAGGISAIETDYVTIENNIVHDNCTQTIFGASGISALHNWNLPNDNNTGYKMIIINNKCYNNILNVEWIGPNPATRVCKITDGNGIIVDDTKCVQTNAIKYLGKTLVANNVCYNNGGAGILAFSSENVDILSNTVYFNQRSKNINDGDLNAALDCDNIRAYNNIIYTNPNNLDNDNNKKPINSLINGTNIDFNFNIVFGGNGSSIDYSNSLKVDPQFINASIANFKLKTTSPAIDKGTSNYIIYKDATGNARPQGNAVDIGAFETSVNTNNPVANGTYILTAKHSGKVLDVKASSTLNGAVVWQYERNNGIAQQWQVASIGNGYYKLEAKCSNKALDVAGPSISNGAPLQQWGYNPNNAGNQNFKIEPTNKGFYKITAKNSGKVVEVGGSNINNEATVNQRDYNNGDNQQWIFEKINNGSTSRNSSAENLNVIQNKLALSPNPAVDNTIISYVVNNAAFVTIQLVDINQKILKTIFRGNQIKGAYNQNVELSKLIKGIYFIKITIGNEINKTEKIIKL